MSLGLTVNRQTKAIEVAQAASIRERIRFSGEPRRVSVVGASRDGRTRMLLDKTERATRWVQREPESPPRRRGSSALWTASVLLIRTACFFEGNVAYRLDPERACRVLGLSGLPEGSRDR